MLFDIRCTSYSVWTPCFVTSFRQVQYAEFAKVNQHTHSASLETQHHVGVLQLGVVYV